MKKIKNKVNFENKKFYLLAETAFSHQGDVNYLKKQIDIANNSKADAIKFQILLNPYDAYSKQYKLIDNLKLWIFSKDEWNDILNYVKEKTKLDIVLLPVDIKALDFCIRKKHMINMIELHSINFNHEVFLNKLSKFNKSVILGTGGRSLADINYSLKYFNNRKKVILMHGFQAFPTNYEDIKLERIRKYKNIFECKIGYADHTSYKSKYYLNLIEYAFLKGAKIIEKHLVVNKGENRIDYESAVNGDDFLLIRKRLNKLIKIMGNKNPFALSENEYIYKNREKQIVTKCYVKKGEKFDKNNIDYKVNDKNSDFSQKQYKEIVGKKASMDIKEGTPIKYCHID